MAQITECQCFVIFIARACCICGKSNSITFIQKCHCSLKYTNVAFNTAQNDIFAVKFEQFLIEFFGAAA